MVDQSIYLKHGIAGNQMKYDVAEYAQYKKLFSENSFINMNLG